VYCASHGNDISPSPSATAEQLEKVLSAVPAGIVFFELDPQPRVQYANDRLYDIFGLPRGDGSALVAYVARMAGVDPDLLIEVRSLRPAEPGREPWSRVFPVTRADGSRFWIRAIMAKRLQGEGEPPVYSCVVTDVTQQVLTERAFNRQRDLYRLVMEDLDEVLFEYDIDADTMHFYNVSGLSHGVYEVMTGYTAYVRRGTFIAPEFIEDYLSILHGATRSDTTSTYDLRANLIGDEMRWWRNTYKLVGGEDGTVQRVIGLVREATEEQLLKERLEAERELAQNLEERASTDVVTGLLNRRALKERVESVLAERQRAAFLMLDLDDFKGVNDELGHQMGDRLLGDLGAALKHLFRAGDVIGRLGGDEFVVFLPGVNQYSAAAARAEAIIAAVAEVREQLGIDRAIGISIGIAMAPTDGHDFQTLYASADSALYTAKEQGKDRFIFS